MGSCSHTVRPFPIVLFALILTFLLFGSTFAWAEGGSSPALELSGNNNGEIVSEIDINTVLMSHTDSVGTVKQIEAGLNHSALLRTDGTLWMWGINSYGELGGTHAMYGTKSLVPIKTMDDVVFVALGASHSAAIKTDGSLWTWGRNNHGQLGDGTKTNHATPAKIMEDVAFVELGWYHSAAIKTDGSLWVWGNNDNGRLGDGTTDESAVPIKIMDDVATVSLQRIHSAAVKTDGSLWMWGNNNYGQIGDGVAEDHLVPTKIMDDVQNVNLGLVHSVALKNDNTLWIWGDNSYNQIGDGTGDSSYVPKRLMYGVKDIAAGSLHSAAVRQDNSLWMWGSNANGQLGLGMQEAVVEPQETMSAVEMTSLGHAFSLAAKKDGTLWSCGFNSNGELGDGTTVTRDYSASIYIGDISNAQIAFEGYSDDSGPILNLALDGYTLLPDDFTVRQTEDSTFIVEGKGLFKGSKVVYLISGASISGIEDKQYCGYAIEQNLLVELLEQQLSVDSEYEISYENNNDVGTATVVISGLGAYIGSVKKHLRLPPLFSK